jgi:CO/xanthine dehydrogenase FAD-binding subunit
MNQPTIRQFLAAPADAPARDWREGDAWLAGGTYLFSTPLPHLRRLVDITTLDWPALTVTDGGLEISATCRVVDLHAFRPPAEWTAGPLLRQSVECFLASFKIWHSQTVGGNICTSLPAGPMITLTCALDATYTLWGAAGDRRDVPAIDFVTGNNRNILRPGELLRSIFIPHASLMRRFTLRRFTLTKEGRSSIFLVGTVDPANGEFLVTVTASTAHPVHLRFAALPEAAELRSALDRTIPHDLYFDDPNGSPDHRRHLTYHFAEQIREELSSLTL